MSLARIASVSPTARAMPIWSRAYIYHYEKYNILFNFYRNENLSPRFERSGRKLENR